MSCDWSIFGCLSLVVLFIQTRFTNKARYTPICVAFWFHRKDLSVSACEATYDFRFSAHRAFPATAARRKTHTPLAQQGFRRRGATEGLNATGLKPPGSPIACGGGRATSARLSRCTVRTPGRLPITVFFRFLSRAPAPENGEMRARGHRAGRSRCSVPRTCHASHAKRAHARERARPARPRVR